MQSLNKRIAISSILILTFLIYSPALFYEFINLDDPHLVTNNPLIHSLSLENIWRIFSSVVHDSYTPLTIFSFALEYRLSGLNPFLYHLDNIFLHLIVVFLIFQLGIVLGLKEKGASVAAFIFALHPMHVESVAWVAERKDVLYSVFYLGAVLLYLNYQQTKKQHIYWASVFLGFFSMLAKPMAVSLPLILLLCDWFKTGTLKRDHWLTKIPYSFIIVTLAWVTYSQNANRLTENIHSNPLFRFWACAFYIKKFFWPINLVVHYVPQLPAKIYYLQYSTSVLIVILSIFIYWKYKNKWLRLACLWFILSIFFLLNFDYPRFMQTVADRYMYLPSVGFCFFLGYFTQKVWDEKYLPSIVQKIALVSLLCIGMFLCGKTFSQITIWKNSFSLWDYTVKHSAQSFWAYNYRGRIFANQKHFDQAIADYYQSIKLNPFYARTYVNLASLLEKQGDISAAIENYSKAIYLNPKYKEALNNRGLLYQKKGAITTALSDFTTAIAANPNYPLAYANRGTLFLQMGELKSALSDLTYAIFLDPNYPDAYINRSICYIRMNLLKNALADCQKAAILNKALTQTYPHCLQIYQNIGEYDHIKK